MNKQRLLEEYVLISDWLRNLIKSECSCCDEDDERYDLEHESRVKHFKEMLDKED